MLETITANDLMQLDLPAPREVITGLLTVGLNVLAGSPKSGKSFLGLGLSLSVANGDPALGTLPVERGNVLYLALEDTRYRIRNRLKGLHTPTPDNLAFATRAPTLAEGGLEALHDHLTANPGTSMVVIDTLAKIADQRTGGNIYDEDSSMGGALHSLAHHHETALLVIHHTRKAAHGDFLHMVSGSAGFTGAADTVMVLTRNRNETTATLEVTGRDIQERKMNLTWLSIHGGWRAAEWRAERKPIGRPADTTARSRIPTNNAPRPYAEGD
jgi:RecA-family ATPase